MSSALSDTLFPVIALALANPAPAEELETASPDLDPKDEYFRTGATLVVVPNTLAKQWAEEIERNTQPPLKVVLLTTKIDHKKVTYQDIADAGPVHFASPRSPLVHS